MTTNGTVSIRASTTGRNRKKAGRARWCHDLAQQEQCKFSAAAERDSSRQAGEFAAYRRMLVVSEGCFSLSFAVCNDRTLRNELIDRLRDDFSGLLIVELPAKTLDVYKTVCDQISGALPRAIFVLDLEASVPSEAKTYPTLRSLNTSRELWEQLACPVVFWLVENAASLVARQVPDFWRYRSHQFEFVSDRRNVGEAIRELFSIFRCRRPAVSKKSGFASLNLKSGCVRRACRHHLMYCRMLSNGCTELAYLYSHASQFDRARELLDRAVSWTDSAYGPDAPRTGVALNNLAQLLKSTNRMAEAEPLFAAPWPSMSRRSVLSTPTTSYTSTTWRRCSSPRIVGPRPSLSCAAPWTSTCNQTVSSIPTSPGTSTTWGCCSRPRTEWPRQRHTCARLGHRRTITRPRAPQRSQRSKQPGDVVLTTNRLAEAESLDRRALAIDEQFFGAKHPLFAIRLNILAQLLQSTNRPAEAEALMPCLGHRRAVVRS